MRRPERHPAIGKRVLRALSHAFGRFARRQTIESVPVVADTNFEPEPTLFERLKVALGVAIDMSVYGLAGEAIYRQDQGLPVGRVSVSMARPTPDVKTYSSSLEAAVDHRLSVLEQDVLDASAQLATEIRREDDVGAAIVRKRLELLGRRLETATRLAPIAERMAIEARLRVAQLEVERLPSSPAPVAVVVPAAIGVPDAEGALLHPMREPNAGDYLHKAALRSAARVTSTLDLAAVVIGEHAQLELQLAAWDAAHTSLAAQLRAENRDKTELPL